MMDDPFQLAGTEVGGVYQVDQAVAEGGFAVVYKAHHSGFKAPVALKCLKIPQHMSPEAQNQFRAQFQAEAQLLFQLSAAIPAVVRPLHVDAIIAPDGRFMPFLALEWLEGCTLDSYAKEHFKKGHRWLLELVELLTPAALGLQLAHCFPTSKGPLAIIHRDIKPENLFVASVGGKQQIKILDFGIGKARSVASQVAGRMSTQSGGLSSFTPAYGAPEQWVPKRLGQTGPWTDVWGLALTLVELYVGHAVFEGDAASVIGAAVDPARRPTPGNEGAPVAPQVELVFEKALAVDPRRRYQDAGVFWNELREALGLRRSTAPEGAARDVAVMRHQELDFGSFSDGGDLELASVPPLAAERSSPTDRAGLERLAAGAERSAPGTGIEAADAPTAARETVVSVRRAPAGLASTAVEPTMAAGASPHKPQRIQHQIAHRLPPVPVRPVGRSLFGICLVPGTALLCGGSLSVLGQAYASETGRVFAFGAVGLGWVTIPMVLGGVLSLVYRLVIRGV